ncbi:carbohydrate-binding module family 14 protein [Jhaorihella thermophila]|uniref:Chitin binding Peritrophin-A domain-containing protein n=1 Tax=Jhaorihella thermophila TaxID=488547 RepID=A0A1H5XWS0_9RHOB|nr:carbohydrate-binding module family 14 protein [Jhaorihella thermophila]SEG15897.1 Chitin binding Peritrophin-A domain-containing protein [Jhaorihella thermophila]
MFVKTVIVTLCLAVLPAAAYAGCSSRGHQAQSCAPGTVWDAASQSCVKQVNS